MVHLCVSISNDGVRLESVQKGSPQTERSRGKKATDTATLRRQPRGRTAASRRDRGSRSSSASCPVFPGPYSDPEEEPPLRRRSSPLILKGSLHSFHSSISSSPHGSLSSLQGSDPCRRGSLPSLRGPLPGFMGSTSNLRGSTSRLKRRSLGSLDPSSPSPSLHGGTGSSSDDDGSWDTSSWSSGATCLLRTPVKKDSAEASGEKSHAPDNASAIAVAEPEIIYQNLIFSHAAAETESVEACAPERISTELREDGGSPSASSSSLSTSAAASSTLQRDDKSEDRRKFSQFLNEVTCRVFKSNDGASQPQPDLRHCFPSSPPSPPMTPSHPSTNLWYSPTSSNLQTIREFDSKDVASSIHQWSKTLPSCKVVEPGEVLRTEKREGHWTKIQTSTGRRYLETDIDSVRRLDELVANGALGRERNGKAPEKVTERGSERENRTPREVNGNSGVDRGKERGKRKESAWERGRRIEKGMGKDTGREMPCWEKDRWMERGREKEKNIGPTSYDSPPQAASSGRSDPCPVFSWPEGFPRMSYRSTSLPRPANITESDGEIRHDTSSLHDHKEDLRKRLSYTTHKLEMVETEFDSTRQYLETELRRAQEELEKFTEKLRRIQSSYAALQRINQDLEDQMHSSSQHHEEEKRTLSREILLLNNHLVDSKITINKLREDNDLYRKDCNLAAQLLQGATSHCRAQQLSELPLDFQERLSSHLEKHNRGGGATAATCHSNYPDAVPTAAIATVLAKPEPGSSCPATRAASPQPPPGGGFLPAAAAGSGTDRLSRRGACKTSDLYCSDTALYCPERWRNAERRQSADLRPHAQNSADSNPEEEEEEEEAYRPESFSHHEPPASFQRHEEFGACSLPASSSYSSFSLASDEKGGVSTLSSSHQGLYMDWREGVGGDYKGLSSYDRDSHGVPKALSVQHMAAPRSPQRAGGSAACARTASCFSEPYHGSAPRPAASHSTGSAAGPGPPRGAARDGRSDGRLPEDELSDSWRRLSVEDINALSSSGSSYRELAGRGAPYGFSEAEGGSLYRAPDRGFPAGARSPGRAHQQKKEKTPAAYGGEEEDGRDSECSVFLSLSSRGKGKDSGSAESLQLGSLEACSLQHYPPPRPSGRPRPSSSSALGVGPALPKKSSPRYQKFGSTGLTRKDSLTKAQLYGTLLN